MTSNKPQTAAAPRVPDLSLDVEYRYRVNRAFDTMAKWDLGTQEQAALLGQPFTSELEDKVRLVPDVLLGGNQDLLARCEHIYHIGLQLDLLFPKDDDLAKRWMRQPNRAFAGRRPLDLATEQGVDTLKAIKTYLVNAC
jgi:hypothetical protein